MTMKRILSITGFFKLPACVLALLVMPPVLAYMLNPATGFTGVGHGPDWRLDIVFSNNAITLKTDEGEVTHHYNKLGPIIRTSENATIYRMKSRDHFMDVVIVHTFCQDIKSGKAYTAKVSISVDGKTYSGCGTEVVPPYDD